MKKLKFITAVFTALVSAMLACMLMGCPNAARNSDKEKTVAVTGVTLNKSAANIEIGDVETLTATVTPANATNKNVTWSSDNPDIAAVDANGKVEAKKEGKAVITVTAEDGAFTATCSVRVNTKPEKNTAVLILSPYKKEINIMAETEDDSKIIVEGCMETSLASRWDKATILHATGEKVVLKGKIIKLSCPDNNLTYLNVQGLTGLQVLRCIGNQLTEINVQGLNGLLGLFCGSNQLTELNVQGLNSLIFLNCEANKLNKAAFTKIFTDLLDRSGKKEGECLLYTEKAGATEGNYKHFTAEELKVIKDKNWAPKKIDSRGNKTKI